MAESVTRHATTPPATDFQPLLSGIDTLDLGLYVTWGGGWKRRLKSLDIKKQQARERNGLVIGLPSGRNCIFRPGGKGETYRFHLQFEAYNVFIGKSAQPGATPNVYVSLAAHTLWRHGIDTPLDWLRADLKAVGSGVIQHVKISRLDICADFHIPGGITQEFLLSHKVTHNEKGKVYLDKDELQTYYAGDASSPVQLRIYNKGIEVQKGGTKLWFLDLWGRESTEDVWRIEFQIRRPALKKFGINTLEDLKEEQAGVWSYLTEKWFSLRVPDNDKAERRTVHPFWSAVQSCALNMGPLAPAKRLSEPTGRVSPEWHLSHIDGCLSSFAALLGITNREDALQELQKRLRLRRNEAEFQSNCMKKAIRRGTLSQGGAK